MQRRAARVGTNWTRIVYVPSRPVVAKLVLEFEPGIQGVAEAVADIVKGQ